METIDALIKAIHEFQGAVLLVSHDTYFLSKVCLRVSTNIISLHCSQVGAIHTRYINSAMSDVSLGLRFFPHLA
jgi:ATPase subunit of ABC transporter with duplicated ATPase domains